MVALKNIFFCSGIWEGLSWWFISDACDISWTAEAKGSTSKMASSLTSLMPWYSLTSLYLYAVSHPLGSLHVACKSQYGSLRIVALLTLWLASKRQKVWAASHKRVLCRISTVSLYSIGQSSHRAHSDSRDRETDPTAWWESVAVTVKESMWDERCCCSQVWKVHCHNGVQAILFCFVLFWLYLSACIIFIIRKKMLLKEIWRTTVQATASARCG